jgi:hypothetical protein
MQTILTSLGYTALDIATTVCTYVPDALVPAVFFGVFLTALVSPLMLPALVGRLITGE